MPTAKLFNIEAWSFSRVQTYNTCPLRAKYLYIDKRKEPEGKSPALAHGTRIHAIAAAWITRKLPDFNAWDGKELKQYETELKAVIKMKEVPRELETFAEELRRLRRLKARCEEMWTLDRQWRLIEGTDWSPHAWLRIKVDVHFIEKGCV